MTRALVLVAAVACGDNVVGGGDAGIGDAQPNVGSLFGEPCVQAPPPAIMLCHDGLGACHDEAAGSVCRPFCLFEGFHQCGTLGAVEITTDRGACLCVPGQ
jgi:hypothetical protein